MRCDLFNERRFVFKDGVESQKGSQAEAQVFPDKAEVFPPVAEAGSEESAEVAKVELVESQQKVKGAMQDPKGIDELSVAIEYRGRLTEYTLLPVQMEVKDAIDEEFDPNGMIQRRITGSLDLFESRLSLEAGALANSAGKADIDYVSGSVKLDEKLSFYTEKYKDGGAMYYGMNINPDPNLSLDLSYSPDDKLFYLSGDYKNLSAGLGLDDKSVYDAYLEYSSGGVGVSLTITPSSDEAKLAASCKF